MQIRATIKRGNRRESLTALRDRLAEEIDGATSSRDVAVLAKQLTDVIRELDSLPAAEEASIFDDLAARRAGRRNAAGS